MFRLATPFLKLSILILLVFLFSIYLSVSSFANHSISKPGILAFSSVSQQSKANGIFTVSATGTNRRKLTTGLSNGAQDPVWSPNGRRLAFVVDENQEIYVANVEGSRLTKVLAEEFCKTSSWSITWSANSERLVLTRSCDGFTSDAPGSISLYLSDTTGTTSTKLIQQWKIGGMPPVSEISSNVYPSPDGSQVGFIRNQNLFKINSDGSGLVQLTHNTAKPGESQPGESQLYWSPDGSRIARIDFFFGETPSQRISLFTTEGTVLGQWNNHGTNWSNPNLVWSPDSQRIAYYQTESSPALELRQNIYLYDLADKTPKNLTRKPGEYNAIAWSPDGQQLAFTFKSAQTNKLYAISLNNLKWTALTPQKALTEVENPAWSPDSQQIAFTAGTIQQNNLYVMNRTGSGLKRLTSERNALIFNPTWRP